jgi:hypothetical protein
MIDLNHGSGCQYEAVSRCAGISRHAIDAARATTEHSHR